MSPVLMSSHSIILAATMAVSGAAIFLSFARPKPTPTSRDRPLRSCLSSEERRREKRKKEKKRVRFSEDVQVFELTRSQPSIKKSVRRDNKLGMRTKKKLCWDEIVAVDQGMPANRVALYHGVLRDRVHVPPMECSC